MNSFVSTLVLVSEYSVDALLGRSAIRRRILAILIDAPGERFHLREIARRARTSAGTASRELARLRGAGLVTSEREGNQLYFRADSASPLYEPVRDMVRRTIGAPAVLRKHLDGIPGVDRTVIFGSYADGRLQADSDVDVLIVGDPDRDVLTEALEEASGELGRDVNEVVMTQVELDARRSRGDGFVASIDAGPVITVIG